MGSMTGAPKIKSMKLIDEFENVSRESTVDQLDILCLMVILILM